MLRTHILANPEVISYIPELLVVAIDAAAMEDGVPLFAEKSKNADCGHSMRLTVVGAKMHGVRFGVFTVLKNIPGGKVFNAPFKVQNSKSLIVKVYLSH